MNILNGHISSIIEEGKISLVSIQFPSFQLHSLIIENASTAKYLEIDKNVAVWFKETELIVSKEEIEGLSCPNQFKGIVQEIEYGKVLSKIKAKVDGSMINAIVPSLGISTTSFQIGMDIYFILKSNEIVISA